MALAGRKKGAHAAHGDGGAWAPRDHHAETTARIVAALEAGVRPWRRPWDPDKAGGGLLAPRNGVTGHRYRGINLVLLAMAGTASGAPDPRWLTYRQAAERGWQVRRGERGTRVFFFRRLAVQGGGGEEEDGNGGVEGTPRRIPLLKAYTVFHGAP